MKEMLLGFLNSQKIPAVLIGISLAFLFAGLFVIAFNINNVSSPLILHFDSFRGVDRFGEKGELWLIWLEVVLFMAVNGFLSHYLFKRERAVSLILLGANVLLALLLFIALATIVSIN